MTTNNTSQYPLLQLRRELNQMQSAFKFLHHMNNTLHDAPRNVTEQNTIITNLTRSIQAIKLLDQAQAQTEQSTIHNNQLASDQFLHDS